MLLRKNEYSSTKFGGTSVADVDRIKKVAKRVNGFGQKEIRCRCVVSARAGVTNQLIERANAILEESY